MLVSQATRHYYADNSLHRDSYKSSPLAGVSNFRVYQVHLASVLTVSKHGYVDDEWCRTPLDFIQVDTHFCDLFWRYYTRIGQRIHLPIFSRLIEKRPYDRVPSDRFLALDGQSDLLGAAFILVFGVSSMFAWNFHFPSVIEETMWRVASVYMLIFTIIGGPFAQYCQKILLPRWTKSVQQVSPDAERQRGPLKLVDQLRNMHASEDHQLVVPLRALIPVTTLCIFYCICRGYILVEDFVGLRSLPRDAFTTVDWSKYVPHW